MGASAEKSNFLIKFFQKIPKTTFLACFFKHLPPPFEKILDPPLHCPFNFGWWPLISALSLGALNSFFKIFFGYPGTNIFFGYPGTNLFFGYPGTNLFFGSSAP